MKLSLAIGALSTLLCITGCSRLSRSAQQHAAADRSSAPNLMIQYGCPACHVIPGVPGAVGKVGPSLDDVAQRSYLAGTLQNSPANLAFWIQHPQQIHPGTAMPEMGVADADARQIASFLETRQ